MPEKNCPGASPRSELRATLFPLDPADITSDRIIGCVAQAGTRQETNDMAVGGAFPEKDVIAELTAKMLLEVEAVHFNAEKPYIFTSGWASPVYIDCRKLISYPRLRQTIIDFGASIILRDAGFEQFDTVAGGETAGIPFAAWMADRLMLPMQYVRKQPKGFGRDSQIEGNLKEGERVLLVEDLTTDGRSKINFCQALRSAGAIVEHVFVVFHYDIFPETKTVMSDMGVTLHALATWWDVLKVAQAGGHFDVGTMDEVEKFLRDPAGWSVAHGGVGNAPS
jgi:orotate phosphoribosyltransferase